jgi:5-methylcytosine-specific restriction endonuclease McrA
MRVKNDIVRMLREGHTYNRIAEELNCSKATVAYHAQKIGVAPGFKAHPWAEIQEHYDAGNSVRACLTKFGVSRSAWYVAKEAGKLVTSRNIKLPLATLMEPERRTCRTHLKDRLLQEGILQAQCSRCRLIDWLGSPISLHLHHVNGKNRDNRLENLQLLCPNCHSQTETYSGRNAAKRTIRLMPDSSAGRTPVSGTGGPRFES